MAKSKKSKKQNLRTSPQQKTQVQEIQTQVHKGPLPSPEVLFQYNEIVSGAAERILIMAESQAKHRQNLELIVVKAGSRDSLLGLSSA